MINVQFRTIIRHNRIPEVMTRFPSAVKAVVAKTAYDIRDDAKALCPVDTGALRASIEAHISGAAAVIMASAEYAGYVEFGTFKMAPRAFMRPAADVNEPKFLAAMDEMAGHL